MTELFRYHAIFDGALMFVAALRADHFHDAVDGHVNLAEDIASAATTRLRTIPFLMNPLGHALPPVGVIIIIIRWSANNAEENDIRYRQGKFLIRRPLEFVDENVELLGLGSGLNSDLF